MIKTERQRNTLVALLLLIAVVLCCAISVPISTSAKYNQTVDVGNISITVDAPIEGTPESMAPAMSIIHTMFEDSSSTLSNYWLSSNRIYSKGSLDSTGITFGQGITQSIVDYDPDDELTSTNFSYSIYHRSASSNQLEVYYYSGGNINSMAINTTVTVKKVVYTFVVVDETPKRIDIIEPATTVGVDVMLTIIAKDGFNVFDVDNPVV